jgi:pimeloyl-ACP methyl ester carboxylesterase
VFDGLLDGLGIDTLFLVGNSYGGFTAAYYAMKLPDRVRKLVLVGPASTIHARRPASMRLQRRGAGKDCVTSRKRGARVAQPSLVAWRRSVRYTVARPMLKSSARSAME